jgi:hypothetical protein
VVTDIHSSEVKTEGMHGASSCVANTCRGFDSFSAVYPTVMGVPYLVIDTFIWHLLTFLLLLDIHDLIADYVYPVLLSLLYVLSI